MPRKFNGMICSISKFMDTLEPSDILYKKCYAALRGLCGEAGELPHRFILPTKKLKKQSARPLSSYGYADVWRGSFDGQEVALKVFRSFQEEDLRSARKVMSHPSSVCSFRPPTLFPPSLAFLQRGGIVETVVASEHHGVRGHQHHVV